MKNSEHTYLKEFLEFPKDTKRKRRFLSLSPIPTELTSLLEEAGYTQCGSPKKNGTFSTYLKVLKAEKTQACDFLYTFDFTKNTTLQEKIALFQECARILKPNGIFLMEMVNAEYFNEQPKIQNQAKKSSDVLKIILNELPVFCGCRVYPILLPKTAPVTGNKDSSLAYKYGVLAQKAASTLAINPQFLSDIPEKTEPRIQNPQVLKAALQREKIALSEKEKLSKDNKNLQIQLTTLQDAVSKANETNQALMEQIEIILASRSWKITSPIRVSKDYFIDLITRTISRKKQPLIGQQQPESNEPNNQHQNTAPEPVHQRNITPLDPEARKAYIKALPHWQTLPTDYFMASLSSGNLDAIDFNFIETIRRAPESRVLDAQALTSQHYANNVVVHIWLALLRRYPDQRAIQHYSHAIRASSNLSKTLEIVKSSPEYIKLGWKPLSL